MGGGVGEGGGGFAGGRGCEVEGDVFTGGIELVGGEGGGVGGVGDVEGAGMFPCGEGLVDEGAVDVEGFGLEHGPCGLVAGEFEGGFAGLEFDGADGMGGGVEESPVAKGGGGEVEHSEDGVGEGDDAGSAAEHGVDEVAGGVGYAADEEGLFDGALGGEEGDVEGGVVEAVEGGGGGGFGGEFFDAEGEEAFDEVMYGKGGGANGRVAGKGP